MFVTQTKYNTMKERITTLEGQVEGLTNSKLEERNKKFKEILNLDEKIVRLEKDKRKLILDVEDIEAKKSRGEEDIQHKVKIVMEKHDLELEKEKQKLEKAKDKEVAKVKDEYRDKMEKQLDKRGTEMKEMYTDVLDKLTQVTGTLNSPARLQANVTDK